MAKEAEEKKPREKRYHQKELATIACLVLDIHDLCFSSLTFGN